MTFDAQADGNFTISPIIYIYRNHNCRGDPLSENGLSFPNNLNRTWMQFEWTPTVNDFEDISVIVRIPGTNIESNCLNTEVPSSTTIPGDNTSPESRSCPTRVHAEPNQNKYFNDETLTVLWSPHQDQIGNTNNFEALLATSDEVITSLPIQEAEISGEVVWIVHPDISSLELGKSYRVTINTEGVTCSQMKLFEVSSGLISGRNPCYQDTDDDGSVECVTALGAIPTDIKGFATRFLTIALGLAGGIALILLVFGAIRVLTSSGDQQRLAGGRDTIIAAVAGLLFLILSVLILRALGLVIGFNFG